MTAVTGDIVGKIGNMRTNKDPIIMAKTGKLKEIKFSNENLPYKLFKDDNDMLFVEMESDDVMNAVLANDPIALESALKVRVNHKLATITRINNGPPMVVACYHGFINCVKVLLEVGSDAMVTNGNGQTGIHLASLNGHVDILQCIFNAFESDERECYTLANHVCSSGRSPLHYAALPASDAGNDKAEVVIVLINNGAYPVSFDKDNKRPSQLCTDASTLKLLRSAERLILTHKELLELGEEACPSDEEVEEEQYIVLRSITLKSDKVMEAVQNDNAVDLKLALLDNENLKFIDTNRDGDVGPPLLAACLYGHKKCVEVLLEFGAYVLATDVFFKTAILMASLHAHVEILDMLFSTAKGDEPLTYRMANKCAWDGQTPLHYAARAKCNTVDAVKFLISKGANPLALDNFDRIPSEYCVDAEAKRILYMAEDSFRKNN